MPEPLHQNRSTTPRRGLGLLWPPLTDAASAREAVRAGALGGLLLIALTAISLVLALRAPPGADPGARLAPALGLVAASLLTLRVLQGRGLAAPVLLLVWTGGLGAAMLAAGTMNFAWAGAFALALVALLKAVRGALALRRLPSDPPQR